MFPRIRDSLFHDYLLEDTNNVPPILHPGNLGDRSFLGFFNLRDSSTPGRAHR
jgi:hypothetical protein